MHNKAIHPVTQCRLPSPATVRCRKTGQEPARNIDIAKSYGGNDFNTRNNDELLLQHPSVGTNSYGRRAFSYTGPTVSNKHPYKIRNAPSVTLLRKKLKTLYFKTSSTPSGLCVHSVFKILRVFPICMKRSIGMS